VSALPPVDRPLDEGEAEAAFGAMLDGGPSDEDIARFLVALSDRGETAAEIAGAARAMIDSSLWTARITMPSMPATIITAFSIESGSMPPSRIPGERVRRTTSSAKRSTPCVRVSIQRPPRVGSSLEKAIAIFGSAASIPR